MSRVFVPDTALWYHELRSVSYYVESAVERVVFQHVGALFPDFYVFPFKKGVQSRGGGETRKPDLGMVQRDLSSWGIIEVELVRHDLEKEGHDPNVERHIREARCLLKPNYTVEWLRQHRRRGK